MQKKTSKHRLNVKLIHLQQLIIKRHKLQ